MEEAMAEQLRPYRVTMRNQKTGHVISTRDMTADEYDQWMDAERAAADQRLKEMNEGRYRPQWKRTGGITTK
jgi:hypothetical protein